MIFHPIAFVGVTFNLASSSDRLELHRAFCYANYHRLDVRSYLLFPYTLYTIEHMLSDVTAQNIWSLLYAYTAYLFVDNTARYVFIINRCSFDEETITNVIKTSKHGLLRPSIILAGRYNLTSSALMPVRTIASPFYIFQSVPRNWKWISHYQPM